MKKISLKNLNLQEVEQLSREQLKNVLGGFSDGSGTEGGSAGNGASYSCSCDNHTGSWTDSTERTSSINCRDSSGNTPGPCTCTKK